MLSAWLASPLMGRCRRAGKTQSLFVRALFTLMGRLAKLDGRVSEEEIQFTTSVMRQLSLSPHQRQSAIDCFYLGKLEATNVMPLVEQLASNLGRGSATVSPVPENTL